MSSLRRRGWLFLVLTLVSVVFAPSARASDASVDAKAKALWQLLDYVALDYRGAVANGAVIDASEYAEMQEFASAAERQLIELPPGQASATLRSQASRLRNAIDAKAHPVGVAQLARRLAGDVFKAYPFAMAPPRPPDLLRGAQLFQARCVACHGGPGQEKDVHAAGQKANAAVLSDRWRAQRRSLFSLYQIISNGVNGTAMAGYGELDEADRWALAFFAGTLAYGEAQTSAGAKLWQSRSDVREAIDGLDALTQTSEHALAERVGADAAEALTAYLRAYPDALAANRPSGIVFARTKLLDSVNAARAGHRELATELARSAYLDGFEPEEPALATIDHALVERIERGMATYCAGIASAEIADIEGATQVLAGLLDEAREKLTQSENDAATTFAAALTVVLRDGLEAILVVAAMVAVLKKARWTDGLVYVHAGWVSALAAGAATWAGATFLVNLSGAGRELTEGLSSLLAGVVLLGSGIWMHRESAAGRWQTFLDDRVQAALAQRAACFLFLLSFVATYREVFETTVFYAELWGQRKGWPLLAGLATGIVALGVLTAALLRTSKRLPLEKVLAATSSLASLMAVVLAGKGIADLQEAGWIHASPIGIPRIEILGIYPTLQTLLAQLAVALAVVIAFMAGPRMASTRQHEG